MFVFWGAYTLNGQRILVSRGVCFAEYKKRPRLFFIIGNARFIIYRYHYGL